MALSDPFDAIEPTSFLSNLRVAAGLIFVCSMISLIIWFFVGTYEKEVKK